MDRLDVLFINNVIRQAKLNTALRELQKCYIKKELAMPTKQKLVHEK